MARSLVLLVAVCAIAAGCTIPFIHDPDNGAVGDAAGDIISGKKYSKLLVEIDYPSGSEPNADAIDALKTALKEVAAKSTISVALDASIPSEPSKKYSIEEIDALAKSHRDRHSSGDTVAVHVLYVAGGAKEDTAKASVLGAAYRSTSLVMFKGNVRASSGGGPLSGKPTESAVERAVLIHEFGHVLGLVNLGAPMVRNHEDTKGDGTGQDGHDPARHGHSTNSASVMYWAVESSAGLGFLCQVGLSDCGIPYQFDADDKADLAKLKEG